MSRNVIKRPRAKRELAEQASFIAQSNPDAAFRFLVAAEKTFRQLAEMPGMGRLWESSHRRLEGVRVRRIHGFEKWMVFYRPLERGVEILHVLHDARDIERILEEEGGL